MRATACFAPYVDEFGEHEEWKSVFDTELIPGFGLSSDCYVVVRNWFGKYYIQECSVSSIWFTNIWGWEMTNGWKFEADQYDRTVFCHSDLQKAIDVCEKKNRTRKVKVKYR